VCPTKYFLSILFYCWIKNFYCLKKYIFYLLPMPYWIKKISDWNLNNDFIFSSEYYKWYLLKTYFAFYEYRVFMNRLYVDMFMYLYYLPNLLNFNIITINYDNAILLCNSIFCNFLFSVRCCA